MTGVWTKTHKVWTSAAPHLAWRGQLDVVSDWAPGCLGFFFVPFGSKTNCDSLSVIKKKVDSIESQLVVDVLNLAPSRIFCFCFCF